MEDPEPEESGTWLQRRGTDLAIWALVILAVIGFAAGATWLLTNANVKLREATPAEAPRDEGSRPERDPAVAPPVQTLPPIAPTGNADPIWLTRPQPVFPERALVAGVQGGVVALECVAEVSGRLGQCRVVSESPAGYDFGANALEAAAESRIQPRRVNGASVPSKINFNVRYRMAP